MTTGCDRDSGVRWRCGAGEGGGGERRAGAGGTALADRTDPLPTENPCGVSHLPPTPPPPTRGPSAAGREGPAARQRLAPKAPRGSPVTPAVGVPLGRSRAQPPLRCACPHPGLGPLLLLLLRWTIRSPEAGERGLDGDGGTCLTSRFCWLLVVFDP